MKRNDLKAEENDAIMNSTVTRDAIQTQADKKTKSKEPMVYTVQEVATMLALPLRTAYLLCSRTTDFRVLRIGRDVRVEKRSFDEWFYSAAN